MKHGRIIIAVFILTMAMPAKSMAQFWWEGFADLPQANSFWEFLQRYPSASGPLVQNPYQIYDAGWRAQHSEIQQYINNNPGWWNRLVSIGPQYYDERFSLFLSSHPEIEGDLSQNPRLIYDPKYRVQHPELSKFLAGHKEIWRSIKSQRYEYSNRGGWGAYNNRGQWRDETWWKENGDWDNQNKWHDRAWCKNTVAPRLTSGIQAGSASRSTPCQPGSRRQVRVRISRSELRLH